MKRFTKITASIMSAAVLTATSFSGVSASAEQLSEEELRSVAQSASANTLEHFVYRDFDGNGTKEAFAAYEDDVGTFTEIYFISSDGEAQLCEMPNVSFLQSGENGYTIVEVDGKSFVGFDSGSGAGFRTYIWGVNNNEPQYSNLSGRIERLMQDEEGNVYTYKSLVNYGEDEILPLYYNAGTCQFTFRLEDMSSEQAMQAELAERENALFLTYQKYSVVDWRPADYDNDGKTEYFAMTKTEDGAGPEIRNVYYYIDDDGTINRLDEDYWNYSAELGIYTDVNDNGVSTYFVVTKIHQFWWFSLHAAMEDGTFKVVDVDVSDVIENGSYDCCTIEQVDGKLYFKCWNNYFDENGDYGERSVEIAYDPSRNAVVPAGSISQPDPEDSESDSSDSSSEESSSEISSSESSSSADSLEAVVSSATDTSSVAQTTAGAVTSTADKSSSSKSEGGLNPATGVVVGVGSGVIAILTAALVFVKFKVSKK